MPWKFLELSKEVSKASKYASCKFSIRDSMSSTLVVLSIFQCGSEKSGTWTTSPNDRQSDRTEDFAAWCMGIYGRNAVSMSTWRVRSGSFHDTVFRFGQGKIDSYNNRQPNSMGSNHERLYRKEE